MTEEASFVIYRIPGKAPILHIQTNSSPRIISDLEELNGAEGFVIAPFRITRKHPAVLIEPEQTMSRIKGAEWLKQHPQMNFQASYAMPFNDDAEKEQERYTHAFHYTMQQFQANKLKKVVLSRTLRVRLTWDFSPLNTFFNACKKYPTAFVYLCYTPVTGMWIGCSPEILLSGTDKTWSTVSLAGTIKRSVRTAPIWDQKNYDEQQLVTQYIRKKLDKYEIPFKEEGPYERLAGEVAHLETRFTFSLTNKARLGSLLNTLHPTPAVCGVPEGITFRFIQSHEKYDRAYYSGFIGTLSPDKETNLYVNLRCMQLKNNAAILYAGGGILPASICEKEWQETNDKLHTMHHLLE